MSRRLALAVGLAALLPCLASAQFEQVAPLSQVWVNPGFYSYHYDRDAGLDDANPGIGFEWPIAPTLSVTGGMFRNSERLTSHYVGVYWMPLEWQGVKFGAAVGGFDGYPREKNGGWFPALLPVAAIEGRHWGLNIAVIPEIKNRLYGAITLQLKYRFAAPQDAVAAPVAFNDGSDERR